MKYPYLVVYNGVEYPPFSDVPIGEEAKTEEVVTEEVAEPKYTKSQINRMSITELKKIAKAEGIKGYGAKTGAELKTELITKFGL